MNSFLSPFHALVLFTLTGFDRLRFCGESRLLHQARSVQSSCHQQRLLFKDFPRHAQTPTNRLREQTTQQRGDVPLQYLDSPDIDKEAVALELAQRHGRCQGRIALLSCLESGLTYPLRKNAAGPVEPRKEKTRRLHYYHYFQHQQLGLRYVRIPSWVPFTVRVGLNGRRWRAQQLHNRNVAFQQRGNSIRPVEDVALAQRLLDEQKQVD
jgi:hypothetical protein